METLETAGHDAPSGISREGRLRFIFAAAALVASYLLTCVVPVWDAPLGYLVLSVAFYTFTAVFALLLGGRISFAALLAFLLGFALSAYRFVHGGRCPDNTPVLLLNAGCFAYYTAALFGNHSGRLGGTLLLDLAKGSAYCFISFTSFFRDLFKPRGAKKGPKTILLTLLSVFIAAAALIAVGSLLSYDSRFAAMMPKIDVDTVLESIIKVHFAVPIAAMVFSLFISSRERRLPGLSTPQSAQAAGQRLRRIPGLILALPAAALLVMYALFFISQWGYYMSAFTHTLPEGYSAAEYAREGFFQLLGVACINAVLLVVMRCFSAEGSGGVRALQRALSILICLATLLLIATAISKMVLYIGWYDLTRRRLEASVFLVFLAGAFLFTLLSLIIPKMKALPFIIGLGLVMLTAFSLVNTDRMIADYNADSYLSGRHDSIDIDYLAEGIGYNGVPALIRLESEASDSAVRRSAFEKRTKLKADLKDSPGLWYEGDLPAFAAEKALDLR
ncbi:MAG: DUF4173 domain-containing protein [Clostridia bacterium]|nr:DUF4173 domain-containing protein [Clostridia bacterium]